MALGMLGGLPVSNARPGGNGEPRDVFIAILIAIIASGRLFCAGVMVNTSSHRKSDG